MTKPWYLSKTIIGGLVGLVGGGLHAFGVTDALVSTEEQARVIELILEVVGFAMVLVGRTKATKDITL